MKKNLRASILFLTIIMLWGIIYPQYALTEDMYRVTQNGREAEKDCRADYMRILTAAPEEIELRFALADEVKEWLLEYNCQ